MADEEGVPADSPTAEEIAAQEAAAAAQAAQGRGIDQYSDEELAALSGQGHSVATQELIRRETARQAYTMTAQQAQAQAVREATEELNSFFREYPALQDQSSEFYRKANALYQRKSAVMGQNVFTQLDAIKTTMLQDRSTGAVAERTRQTGVDATASLGGVSHQRGAGTTGARTPPARRLTPKETDLGQRMRVKDPGGAVERLKTRVDKGQVFVTPNVSSALGDVL